MGTTALGRAGVVRVMVVDDSALMRHMLTDVLEADGLQVVGTACDGLEGLTRLRESSPDVVVLDVEMPRRNGVEFLAEAMQTHPVRVVVFSSLTPAGSNLALQCLELGAVTCLLKPSGTDRLGIRRMAPEIVRAVRVAAVARLVPATPQSANVLLAARAARGGGEPRRRTSRPANAVLVLAASAGGPAALNQVIPALPASLPAAVLIVQHLPPGFTAALAARVDSRSAIPVREAAEGERLHEGEALVAPGGWHMEVDREGVVRLHKEPPVWGVRPAADRTLRSCAERFGPRVVACVLTGLGRDGALGAALVRAAGGVVLAQDKASSVVWGMPRAVFEAGAANALVPLSTMASEAVRWLRQVTVGRSAAA